MIRRDSGADHDDRRRAADLLRRARAAAPAARCEAAAWAALALPESRAAQRSHATALIEADDLEHAEALIARLLLQRPTDPALATLRAEILHRRGRHEQAAREIDLALHGRPHHGRTLHVAGAVAAALGDHRRAADLLRRALHGRNEPAVRRLYVEALLAQGEPGEAGRAMRALGEDSVALGAAVLRAQGRVLDAVDLLESGLSSAAGPAERDVILAALIDALECAGDHRRLRQVVTLVAARHHPEAMARAARALLPMGDFDRAARLGIRLARTHPAHEREALHGAVVASALAGRVGLARRALQRITRSREGVDRLLMAELWRRGLLGRLITNQSSPRAAGADPVSGLLQPMLRQALGSLDEAIRGTSGPTRADLVRHRSMCAAATEG